jgi:hypothetical protein
MSALLLTHEEMKEAVMLLKLEEIYRARPESQFAMPGSGDSIGEMEVLTSAEILPKIEVRLREFFRRAVLRSGGHELAVRTFEAVAQILGRAGRTDARSSEPGLSGLRTRRVVTRNQCWRLPSRSISIAFFVLLRHPYRRMLMNQKSRIPRKLLETGQVWRMEDSHLDIDLVGKYLVHYKLIKQEARRTPMSLSSIKDVEKYLKDNKAVLVPG